MTIGAFLVLSVIGPDADDIEDLRGLGKRNPFLALSMCLCFLGLAGLPPGMAGLMGKVYLFSGAISSKFYGLAIIAVLNSALACAYYFRVPAAMFFQPPRDESAVVVSPLSAFALGVCVAAVVGIGVFPEPLVAVCSEVAAVAAR
jgi:NADH-quinone oxidoreductase subunit N